MQNKNNPEYNFLSSLPTITINKWKSTLKTGVLQEKFANSTSNSLWTAINEILYNRVHTNDAKVHYRALDGRKWK